MEPTEYTPKELCDRSAIYPETTLNEFNKILDSFNESRMTPLDSMLIASMLLVVSANLLAEKAGVTAEQIITEGPRAERIMLLVNRIAHPIARLHVISEIITSTVEAYSGIAKEGLERYANRWINSN